MTNKKINILGISVFVCLILFVVKNMIQNIEFFDVFYIVALIYLFVKYIFVITHD